MKKILTLIFFLTLGLGFQTVDAVVDIKPSAKESTMSAKELRKAKKHEKRTKKMKKMLEKAQKKVDRKMKKKAAKDGGGLKSLDKNLRLAIIFGIAAVAVSIVAGIVGGIWWAITPLWIVALVFLILWLINDA